jgi:Carbohydrate-selective porin, OprB family/S-layer homology domain
MLKVLLNSLLFSPTVLGAALVVSSSAIAGQIPSEVVEKQADVLAFTASTDIKVAEMTPVGLSQPDLKISADTKPSSVVKTATPAPLIAQAAPSSNTGSIDSTSRYSLEGKSNRGTNPLGQVTSVSQLSDVRPTDWAFQALQSLVERYGCIAGYPDRTYRGNRALTRYEFAAGLNACLDRVNELIAAATADLVKKEDLATLQKLQEEFAAELATLRGRVDALEARTTTLEKQQFSTTTKLAGEAVFAITDEFGVNNTGGNNTVFQDRVRLALNTSFTGSDLLVTRLTAGNANAFTLTNPNLPGGTNSEGLQTFNFRSTGGNQVSLDRVAYSFNLAEKARVYISAVGGIHPDYAPTSSPALDSGTGATGPLSLFAERNPIYFIGGGSGVGVNFQLTPAFTISAGYLADNSDATAIAVAPGANNPSGKNGLFNGSYSALAQVTFKASEALSLGLTYVNAYRRAAIFDAGSGGSGFLGTSLANQGVNEDGNIAPARVNAYGAEVAFRLSPGLVLNGFGSYIDANFVGDGRNSQEIWTYGVGLALPDFGKKGNLLGFVAGAEPYLGNALINSVPLHFEGFYKYQLNDNISITPGVVYIVNPGQDNRNDDVVIGTLRTTFTF